jgi:hypothetical protein
MSSRFPRLAAQLYFLGLAAINAAHGVLPFFLRRGLYRLCRFEIAPSATVQHLFHVSRWKKMVWPLKSTLQIDRSPIKMQG